MLITDLRARLLEERTLGRKVAVIVLSPEQLRIFVADLPGKVEPFDLFSACGVPVLVKTEVLDLSGL